MQESKRFPELVSAWHRSLLEEEFSNLKPTLLEKVLSEDLQTVLVKRG